MSKLTASFCRELQVYQINSEDNLQSIHLHPCSKGNTDLTNEGLWDRERLIIDFINKTKDMKAVILNLHEKKRTHTARYISTKKHKTVSSEVKSKSTKNKHLRTNEMRNQYKGENNLKKEISKAYTHDNKAHNKGNDRESH